jgi:hypothetical protein
MLKPVSWSPTSILDEVVLDPESPEPNPDAVVYIGMSPVEVVVEVKVVDVARD